MPVLLLLLDFLGLTYRRPAREAKDAGRATMPLLEGVMSEPVDVQLNEEVRRLLEGEAVARGVDLAAYLRELATAEARRIRNVKIRKQSEAVEAYVASNAEAREFYEDWGTPSAIF